MPQVPRYNQPQVNEKAAPAVRGPSSAPIEAFGGGRSLDRVTNAARGLAETGLDIYEAEKRKADDINIRDADISAAEVSNKLEQGVRNLKGKDAASAPDYISENWDKETEKITAGLNTDNQRIAADRILRARRMQLDETANIHMASEFKQYDAQRSQAVIELNRNEGSMKYNRPGAVAKSIFEQEKEIDSYGQRNKFSPEWIENAKAKAKSGTYREVLERMMTDGNDKLAKEYEKGISKFLLPDDVAILEKVRKEDAVRKADIESELERQMYLKLADSSEPDDVKLNSIEGMLRDGKIKMPLFNRARGWVLNSFDDADIPTEKKVSTFLEAMDKFKALEGVDVDDKGKPISAAKGNDIKKITDFRQWVTDNKGNFTRKQYAAFIANTEADFDAKRAPKLSFMENLRNVLSSLPNLNPMAHLDFLSRGMEILNRDVPVQQAADAIQKIKAEATVDYKVKFPMGSKQRNPQGVWIEVTGYDETTGKPTFDRVK